MSEKHQISVNKTLESWRKGEISIGDIILIQDEMEGGRTIRNLLMMWDEGKLPKYSRDGIAAHLKHLYGEREGELK